MSVTLQLEDFDDIPAQSVQAAPTTTTLSASDFDEQPAQSASASAPAQSVSLGRGTSLARVANEVGLPLLAGAERGTSDLYRLIMSGADKLYGTNFAGEQQTRQKPLDQLYAKKFENNPIAQGVQFVGEQIPALVPGLGLASDVQKATKAIPLIGKIPGLAGLTGNAALGAEMSAAASPEGDRLQNAELGAGIGAVTHLGAGALNKLAIQPLASGYAKLGIPGLVDKATDAMRGLISPEGGAQALEGAYNKANTAQKSSLSYIQNMAKNLDSRRKWTVDLDTNMPVPKDINASPVVDYIKNYISKKGKLEPASRTRYLQALDFASNEAPNLVPKSFQGILDSRQAANSHLQKFLNRTNAKSADYETKQFLRGLKEKLSGVVDVNANMMQPGEADIFKKAWEKWNKEYQDVKLFEQAPDKTGAMKKKRVLKDAFGGGKEGRLDAGVLSEYMPKSQQQGAPGIVTLGRRLGNEDKAAEIARSYLTRDIFNNSTTGRDVLKAYGKLSPTQRSIIFGGTPEGKLLEAANNAGLRLNKPEAFRMRSLKQGPNYIEKIPGVQTGMELLKAGVGKTATPRLVNFATNLSTQGIPSLGRIANILLQAGLGGR